MDAVASDALDPVTGIPGPSGGPGKSATLLVENDAALAALLAAQLNLRGFSVSLARSGREALRKLAREPYDLVVTDLMLGAMDGLEVLVEAKKLFPEIEVVLLTGHASVETAVAAMKAGAFDYLRKPVDPVELAMVLHKALEHRSLNSEVRRLREEVRSQHGLSGIVCASASMKRVIGQIRKVAETEAAVLLTGESGTGKEIAARAIHERSPRRMGGFVAVNCGALPEGLIESELFGHVKGAFTGAERNKRGLFQEASGGTIFLDEICETTASLQVKLLRALQDGEIRRVGDNHPIMVSCRLIAATNKDLAQLVARGKFREDLYYRLKVFPITLPPLRERPEDVLPLAEHFLAKARKKTGGRSPRFSPEAAAALKSYAWPGNVRELEHSIERILIMASSPLIGVEDLPPEIQPVGRS